MTTTASDPIPIPGVHRARVPAGRDGFLPLLRAEWTKFRTVRGWVIGMVVAAVAIVGMGLLGASETRTSDGDQGSAPRVLLGPGGRPVSDSFTFVHQPLRGDGTITARVTSLTGGPAVNGGTRLHPWSKAGLIVKDGVRQGSSYAAVMVTGGHGVRLQHDFFEDTAGRPGGVSPTTPAWLRLTRAGDTLTGYESVDGVTWREVGTAALAGLPAEVEVGLFVTSPQHEEVVNQELGGVSINGTPTQAEAVFDNIDLGGQQPGDGWASDVIDSAAGEWRGSGGTMTLSGSGDIAPAPSHTIGISLETTLVGTVGGFIAVIVVATLFITAEYRRGLILTTLAASPRRGRVLAAKAIVVGTATFVTGLVSSAVAVALGKQLLRDNGNFIYPVSSLTELRLVAGTAALLAVSAVFALAVGALMRRSASAVAAVIGATLLPHLFAAAPGVPMSVSDWLMRITPGAGFAIQQTVPQFAQVDSHCSHVQGCYPVEPWAGFAVLCVFTALTLGLAVVQLRRRDA